MEIWIEGNKIGIKFQYDIETIKKIKSIPGREWNPLYKRWELPNTAQTLEELRQQGFDISNVEIQKEEANKNIKKVFSEMKAKIKETYPFLFDFQTEAVAKGYLNNRFLNLDLMGLGKTLEGFAPMDRWMQKGKIDRIVIFCPATIKWQWKRKILEFFNRVSIVIEGTPEKRKKLYASKPNIMILNYELLLKDFLDIFDLSTNQGIILDEITYVKNPDAKRTFYVKNLKPKYMFGLTGTLVENKLIDAFHIGNLIHPGWMTKSEFYNYCIFEEKFGYSSLAGYRNLDMFMERLMEISIRRTWEDVDMEMPKKIVEERNIPMSSYQKKISQILIDKLDDDLHSDEKVGATLKKFVILPMLEDSTQLLNMSSAPTLRSMNELNVSHPKIDDLMNILEESSDKKIIIFTRFARMAQIIFEKLNEKHKTLLITGSTSNKQRENIIQKFSEGDERIMVSTDAMSHGVDFPFVSLCINYDIPWKPSTLYQRIHRCYRANSQYNRLLVINMVSDGLESYIYDVMNAKDALFKKVTSFDVNRQLLSYIHKFTSHKLSNLKP